MKVLIDTSVWVDHFRRRNDALIGLMAQDSAMTHPMVVAELACGTPPAPRRQTLGDIALLLQARQATLEEVMDFIEREELYGLGCDLVDLALLASTLITPDARLWTLDQRLQTLAERFKVRYHAPIVPSH
ncbi:MAG: Ribonuclease VapC32 [Paracidovorax wautersii]|uniref:Ribonuclease VapC32 n=1 Tax=Paracidovorax wautersii TaxID=1177982 RepID=A0A7V8JRW4_9BURK|nr:MAG: Ribonuclease VapC32 [Paracidovorax wautersii]